jgi:hypothetical protein
MTSTGLELRTTINMRVPGDQHSKIIRVCLRRGSYLAGKRMRRQYASAQSNPSACALAQYNFTLENIFPWRDYSLHSNRQWS